MVRVQCAFPSVSPLSATVLNCVSCLPCPQSSLKISLWAMPGPWSRAVVAGTPWFSGFTPSSTFLSCPLSDQWCAFQGKWARVTSTVWSTKQSQAPTHRPCDLGLPPWLTRPQRWDKVHPLTPRSFLETSGLWHIGVAWQCHMLGQRGKSPPVTGQLCALFTAYFNLTFTFFFFLHFWNLNIWCQFSYFYDNPLSLPETESKRDAKPIGASVSHF